MQSCASARPPVPPGVLPSPRPLSSEEEQYGHTILQQLSQKYRLTYDDPRYKEVERVVARLTKAAGADKDPWHVFLFADDSFVNAAATRGNHVFVWTGLFKLAKTEDQLATVLSHEIAHVLARHTDPDPNEQLKKILIGMGSFAAGIAVSATVGPSFGQTVGNITSSLTNEVGSGLFVYPYSREMELEADKVGLLVMARAGYDPEKAIQFWSIAAKSPQLSQGPQFFSTHPGAEDRIAALKQTLPYIKQDLNRRSQLGGPETPPAGPENFDFSRITPDANDSLQPWRVAAPKAILYSRPAESSRPVGEFRKGAVIEGIRQPGNWIKIEKPDQGFLNAADLTRIFHESSSRGR